MNCSIVRTSSVQLPSPNKVASTTSYADYVANGCAAAKCNMITLNHEVACIRNFLELHLSVSPSLAQGLALLEA